MDESHRVPSPPTALLIPMTAIGHELAQDPQTGSPNSH
jgi:hypothetical protein